MAPTDDLTASFTPAQLERYETGRALREQTPRSRHAEWQPTKERPDPIELLIQSSQGRVASLIPLRYGRMKPSPFTFLRGAAAIMAADLAQTPTAGIRVQSGGDCHISNFGGYGTPERNLVFDLNDFDETTIAPFEWDVKRLATSIVTAGQGGNGLSNSQAKEAAQAAVCSYRQWMLFYATQGPLEVWYSRIDDDHLLDIAQTDKERQQLEKILQKAAATSSHSIFPKLTENLTGEAEACRIRDDLPLVRHQIPGEEFQSEIRSVYAQYFQNARADVKLLLSRYQLVDLVMKVVGVGSVGTRCALLLLMSDKDPLFLQVKEARASALAPYVGHSSYTNPSYTNQGERVVTGQRLMQAASDSFLGWAKSNQNRDFYLRQFRDMKLSIDPEQLSKSELVRYGVLCGWALARAHARAGDPVLISGYLGKGDPFDQAIADFALAYAEQTAQDHAKLVAAIESGRLPAEKASGKEID